MSRRFGGVLRTEEATTAAGNVIERFELSYDYYDECQRRVYDAAILKRFVLTLGDRVEDVNDRRVQLRFCKCSRTSITALYRFYPYYSIAHGTFAPPFKLLLRNAI